MCSARLWVALLVLASPLCVALSPLASSGKILGCINRRKGILHVPNDISHPSSLHSYSSSGLQPEREPEQKRQLRPLRERPVELSTMTPLPKTQLLEIPTADKIARPKVVVFGASGRLGRRIIQTLMSSQVDVDVVAFVRDYDKLNRALYNNEDLVLAEMLQREDRGPKLRIIIGDLVYSEDIFDGSKRGTIENENSTFFNDFEDDDDYDEDAVSIYNKEALTEAISGCTALISCVGANRPTNFWTDYLRVPFIRILKKDVSKWCSDPTHPYYVKYLTTKHILEEAETEQLNREKRMEYERELLRQEEKLNRRTMDKEESIALDFRRRRLNLRKIDTYSTSALFADLRSKNSTMHLKSADSRDRIKFIQISDVNVGRNPWRLGNVLTNVFRSVAFQYDDMAEKLLKNSKLVDTIVLRIGDVTAEDRNVNKTSLQLSVGGRVPSPSVVGRDDVAELAVITAITQIHDNANSSITSSSNVALPPPKHFTWAVRWAGQHLTPPQGLRPDGSSSAALCFVKAMQAELVKSRQKEIEKVKRDKIRLYHGGKQLIRFRKWLKSSWRLKPYALSSALVVYFTIVAMSWYTLGSPLICVTKWMKKLFLQRIVTKLIS